MRGFLKGGETYGGTVCVTALVDPVRELLSGTAYALDDYYDHLCEAIGEARWDVMQYYDPPDYDPVDLECYQE